MDDIGIVSFFVGSGIGYICGILTVLLLFFYKRRGIFTH